MLDQCCFPVRSENGLEWILHVSSHPGQPVTANIYRASVYAKYCTEHCPWIIPRNLTTTEWDGHYYYAQEAKMKRGWVDKQGWKWTLIQWEWSFHEWDKCSYTRDPTEFPSPSHQWGHSEKSAVCSLEEGLHQDPTMLVPWFWTSSFPNYEK